MHFNKVYNREHINDTIFGKMVHVPSFGTRSQTLQLIPWNQFLHQITSIQIITNLAS